METTSTLGSTDGSIEGAIASMIQPDEGAPIESEAHHLTKTKTKTKRQMRKRMIPMRMKKTLK